MVKKCWKVPNGWVIESFRTWCWDRALLEYFGKLRSIFVNYFVSEGYSLNVIESIST